MTSASNAEADGLCQGRHQAQIGLPEIVTEDSSFGQGVHDALKTDDPSKLSPEQLSVYESCVEIREKLIMEAFGMDASIAKRIREERYWWASTDGKLRHSGQVDLLVVHNDKGLLIDYKALPGEVSDSSANPQLRDQVSLVAGAHKLNEVDAAIIQPLVTHTPEITRYDTQSILRSQVEMGERVAASNDPHAKRTAGAAQCKFCKARFICKEYSQFIALAAPASMSSLTVPVHEWTPDQRALFCERLPIATKWLEECKAQIKKLLAESPKSVPGWKLADGSIRRPITNPNELHTRFLALGGTTGQFMECVEIAKGKLEAQVRAATALKGKGLKAKIDELLVGIVEEKKDAPSLERSE